MKPEIQDPAPQNRNPKPETQIPKSETRKLNPKNQNPRLELYILNEAQTLHSTTSTAPPPATQVEEAIALGNTAVANGSFPKFVSFFITLKLRGQWFSPQICLLLYYSQAESLGSFADEVAPHFA